MRRGEVWWAKFPRPLKDRPVVLLSRHEIYEVRGYLTIAPITSTVRGIDSHVPVGPDDGLRQTSAVNLDDIQTISKRRLDRRIAVLTPDKMAQVNEAIRFALALP
jgi:mRNA interferase MazF